MREARVVVRVILMAVAAFLFATIMVLRTPVVSTTVGPAPTLPACDGAP